MKCNLCFCELFSLVDDNIYDYEYGAPGTYAYWKCGHCALLTIDPMPDGETLTKAYPENYHAYHPHASGFARYLKRRFWGKKAARYAQYISKNDPVLELGCSLGDLLVAFKELGFTNLKGMDFNSLAVEMARQRGLDVLQGEIQTTAFRSEQFQMIVMENFMEHIYNPLDTFLKCNSLLRIGGFLVGETPNVDSWDFRCFRKYWGGYHAPRHLHLFNTDNLVILAERTGFRVKRVSNLLQPAHWALSVQNALQDLFFKRQLKGGRSFYFIFLLTLSIPINFIQIMFSKTSSVEFVFEKIRPL